MLAELCNWNDVDIYIIGTQPPCPRCGLLEHLVKHEVSKLAATRQHRCSVQHFAWNSCVGQSLCGEASPYVDIGTAHEVAEALHIEVDWGKVQAVACANDVRQLDQLLRPVENAAKKNKWLMTPVFIMNGRVLSQGSVPQEEFIETSLQKLLEPPS